ncbi:hypothetical protein DTO013E5_2652 [Penicillium roqueforti]|nr:hypothetical protein CBS147337_4920 [Penicillium roqueforti]KAI2670464.1 hypothetical protein CBS147355_9189 [Penicillium roqueforti]KAI2702737.1 hypothetical protein CBS147354_9737 [Penicillium roqueforti]KAI2710097.1 hypothetical protein CBS147332_5798 [Penicillium roqueforti]KAI2719573.1 hypothetical protein CBS147318_2879 [Penicillium roqueforti]
MTAQTYNIESILSTVRSTVARNHQTVERDRGLPRSRQPLFTNSGWGRRASNYNARFVFFLLSFHRFGVGMFGGESLVGGSPWISG